MENQTAFDLNHAVQNWRENLAQSPALQCENLNELESHLRDSIITLQARGLSAEEAFIIATRRIGTNGALEKEFGKVNGGAVWLDRCLWILLGFQAWSGISSISGLTTSIMSPLGMRLNDILPGLGMQKITEDWLRTLCWIIFSPLSMAFVLGILAWYFVKRYQQSEIIIQKFLKKPWALACGLFITCFILRIAAAWTFQIWALPIVYHIPNVIVRGPVPMSAVAQLPVYAILACLTVLVARRRLRTTAA